MKKISKLAIISLLSLTLVMLLSTATLAASAGMPWESPLQKILDSLNGPVAKIIGTIAIIGTGLGLAFGEGGGTSKKLLMIVFGLSIAFTASTFFIKFFGFTGGVSF